MMPGQPTDTLEGQTDCCQAEKGELAYRSRQLNPDTGMVWPILLILLAGSLRVVSFTKILRADMQSELETS